MSRRLKAGERRRIYSTFSCDMVAEYPRGSGSDQATRDLDNGSTPPPRHVSCAPRASFVRKLSDHCEKALRPPSDKAVFTGFVR